ncbi:MAG: NotI family restriction endonuclease [bacterium]|nr:NotI family restriction endonuclease [bacterium]
MPFSTMSDAIVELFTVSTRRDNVNWSERVVTQPCSYLDRKCVKVRKSQPEISIGTCSIRHGTKQTRDLVICPHRFLERGQIFLDCLHLLTQHEPGNELHRVAEVEVPGGSVDYFLVSVHDGKVVDFVGIELQALDTTGTLWPARQRFLNSVGLAVEEELSSNTYGVNWKMTAKTTLVQLHHKVETFEALGKNLVLVLQDHVLGYMGAGVQLRPHSRGEIRSCYALPCLQPAAAK